MVLKALWQPELAWLRLLKLDSSSSGVILTAETSSVETHKSAH